MSDILDNELVRKYFNQDDTMLMTKGGHFDFTEAVRASMVLRAMQQPIRKGERYLASHDIGRTWGEYTITGSDADDPLHPYALRLPDKFQVAEPDPVEEKIKEIKISLGWCDSKENYLNKPLDVQLEELIALARAEK